MASALSVKSIGCPNFLSIYIISMLLANKKQKTQFGERPQRGATLTDIAVGLEMELATVMD